MKAIKIDGNYYELPIQVADGYYYRSLEDMEDEIMAIRAENIRDALGMSPSAWARAITDYVFDSLEKETERMNTATNSNGTTFKVGDHVKSTTGFGHGTITSIQVNVRSKDNVQILNLHNLTHYDGPSSEEDAWERVTMDILEAVSEQIGPNGYTSRLYEADRRGIRHNAYVVLGSVMKVTEEVKARVRGIIERAEKRVNDRN